VPKENNYLKNWSTLLKSTISMEVLIEEEVSLRRSLSYYHTKDTRNALVFKVCDLGKI